MKKKNIQTTLIISLFGVLFNSSGLWAQPNPEELYTQAHNKKLDKSNLHRFSFVTTSTAPKAEETATDTPVESEGSDDEGDLSSCIHLCLPNLTRSQLLRKAGQKQRYEEDVGAP